MSTERTDPSLWAIIYNGRPTRVFSGDEIGYATATREAGGNPHVTVQKISLFEVSENLTEYAVLLEKIEEQRNRYKHRETCAEGCACGGEEDMD